MTGTFALTFDTELIWGTFDSMSPDKFERGYPDIRGTIDMILILLQRYEIAATWAVVGHLFLGECSRDRDGVAHPNLVRPRQRWRPGDWYAADPCTDRVHAPLWYGDDVLDMIQGAGIAQEIGCHSFAHVLFADPDLTRQAVDSDLDACVALAAERGIVLRSFVFPRNLEGHHEALRDHGFIAFRGTDPVWHARMSGLPARAAHLADQAVGLAPPVSQPSERLPGLWNVPGSALLIHRTGMRRVIPMASRLRKARLGLQRATASGGVFHLWTHPFNLAGDPAFMLATLDAILSEAAAARDRGDIVIDTMGEIARRRSAGATTAPAKVALP